MAVAKVAFVNFPAVSPTIVYDLHTPTSRQVRVEGFTLGAPVWEAAPESVAGQYGYRTVSFDVLLSGTYANVATAMQAIARELLAERNWLLVQPDTSRKQFFLRTYRTQQEAVEWRDAGANKWVLPVTLAAEPFLYGDPITLGPVTITNNPAAGTNPMWYKFAAVLGDAPAPLTARMSLGNTAATRVSPLLSVAALDSGQNPTGPVVWQASAFSLGTDASVVTGDAAMSAGSRVAVSFASNAGLVGRVSGVAPSVPPVGTHKVLLRVRKSAAASAFQIRLAQLLAGTTYYRAPVVTYAAGTNTPLVTWLDLGEFTFPFGMQDPEVTDASLAAPPTVALDVARVAGTGTLDLDAFLLVPVDTAVTEAVRTTAFNLLYSGATETASLDAERRRFTLYDAAGNAMAQIPPQISGGYPQLVPGATNVLHLVRQTLNADVADTAADSITATEGVSFYYIPRYLHMRPDTT